MAAPLNPWLIFSGLQPVFDKLSDQRKRLQAVIHGAISFLGKAYSLWTGLSVWCHEIIRFNWRSEKTAQRLVLSQFKNSSVTLNGVKGLILGKRFFRRSAPSE